MYSAVSTNDYEFTDTEMDDRESIYFDTISVAGSEPNRKSLSLSRQTIYHSADDLPAYETVSTRPKSAGISASHNRLPNHNDIHHTSSTSSTPRRPHSAYVTGNHPSGAFFRRQSTLLDVGDYRDLAASGKDETWRRFQDGARSVDFVLAYRGDDSNAQNLIKRRVFEANLESEGLHLEREKTQKIHFVKIHAPLEVLCRYCEILKMKMPIKKLAEQEAIAEPEFQLMQEVKSFFGRPFEFVKLDRKLFPEKEYTLMFEYSRNYDYLFDVEDPCFFSPAIRNSVVNFILERQRFTEEESDGNAVGIEKLISDGVYQAAYPLHDGDCHTVGSQRLLLLNEWASVRKWIKHQPLENIKDYFGAKVALYFAWLGFYTHMLIPASIAGLICFIYGLITLSNDKISRDTCDDNNDILMCPQCDAKCDYWYLKETCIYSKISYLFDNNFTVFFAFFMSFWAVLYLELWKRYSASLIHRWGLTDFCTQAEHPRPQYLARLNKKSTKKKFNVIHRVLEPHVPFWKTKFPAYIFSYSIVFLFIVVALIAVFAVVIYRMSTNTAQNFYGNTDSMSYKIMILPATGAIINLVLITILNYAYDYLAVYLTNIEYRRTKTEYDESLTLKIYLFQFINYYSSIFYIAFLKGKFVGYPAKYNRIMTLRQEECSPGGCLMELCIQLVIIMVGKQAINAVLEMFIPWLVKKFNTIKEKIGIRRSGEQDILISCNQWTEDFKLMAWSSMGLFEDYLEMIIQYGFITIFVVAFPLAPLFALANNVFEMRLDAKKFLRYYRRPVAHRVKDIGVWYNIMSIIGRIAVASSAFIIAFSSNFIPQLVYKIVVAKNHTYEGYLNHSLAYFDIADFPESYTPVNTTFVNITTCRYPEYRNPPESETPYKRPLIYWHILVARLAFIVVFQNVVGMVQNIVSWAIPDKPRKLRDRIKREEYLTREIIIEQEKRRAKAMEMAAAEAADTNLNPGNPGNPVENGNVFTDVDLIDGAGDTQQAYPRRRIYPDMIFDRTTPV